MVAKATNAYNRMEVYYKHSIPPTRFSHRCHPQGGVLHKEWIQ
jgi:hypothetical protein